MAFLAGATGACKAQQPETFQIGLAQEVIEITPAFTGTELVVFGALDNADGRALREGRYDIVVALIGPRRPLVVREKERIFGLWINSGSESFEVAPASYILSATSRLRDLAPLDLLKALSLGISNVRLGLRREGEPDAQRVEFAQALRRIKKDRGLYAQTVGSVRFVSQTLFRTDLNLPADLPVGTHTVYAFLFRDGTYIQGREETLRVVKVGIEGYISTFAVEHAFLYGVFAVVLAVFTGWFGRIMFKRD